VNFFPSHALENEEVKPLLSEESVPVTSQDLAATQETDQRSKKSPLGFGVDKIDHEEPFHFSANVLVVPPVFQ
jgi:hypothetical protein